MVREYNLRRFIAIASVLVILLSIAWNSVGKGYNTLLIGALATFLPAGTQVQSQGHVIRMTAMRDVPPVQVRLERDGQPTMVGQANIYFGSPQAQNEWLSENPGMPVTTYFQGLEGRVYFYALIPTVALMLSIPGLTLRGRALGLAAVLSLGFCAHLAGLYLIAQSFVWWANNIASTADPGRVNGLILSPFAVFLFFSPLLVCLPITFFRWRTLRPY